ncbi:hypothetical protein LY76DRAFT_582142 [Colletotrichum caudatum]|nr:hypothetical protein LY76DRAFT_582142 [Colletotrichum caudatum]
MSLKARHQACNEHFKKLCKAATESGRFVLDLQDEFDKYSLWAGNVGAGHPDKLSLDHRLREASIFRHEISRLLEILQVQLEKLYQILVGERIPFENWPPDVRSNSFLPDGQDGTESDPSWDLSSESETDMEFAPGHTLTYQQRFTQHQTTESEQLLDSIKLAVKSLCQMPVRRPAPIDRLRDKTSKEVSCFEEYDVGYIKDKFPDSRLSQEVKTRLGNLITKRRQLVRYRRDHLKRLQDTIAEHEDSEQSEAPANIESKARDEAHEAVEVTGAQSERESAAITKAKTLGVDQMPVAFGKPVHYAPSTSRTSVAAIQFTREIAVEVPPRPLDQEGNKMMSFECGYCHLTTHITSDSEWKKHVLDDLQPYVCTFPDCTMAGHLFENRNEWFDHEKRCHRFEYFCNTQGHEKYTQKDEFETHLRQYHGIETDTNSPTPLTQNPHFRKCRKCRISPPLLTPPPFSNYHNITYTYPNRFKFSK